MEVLLILGGLVSLWVAARVGYRRRLSKWQQNPIGPKPDPMRPGIAEAGALALVLGVLGCGFGVAQFLSPDYSPSTGHWSWLWNSVYAGFGPKGVAAVWLGLGGTLIAVGVGALKRP
jgi:hypothetical protein